MRERSTAMRRFQPFAPFLHRTADATHRHARNVGFGKPDVPRYGDGRMTPSYNHPAKNDDLGCRSTDRGPYRQLRRL